MFRILDSRWILVSESSIPQPDSRVADSGNTSAPVDLRQKVCVVGAGSSGLTVAKNFCDLGFEVDLLERHQDLGGLWNYDSPGGRVYRSTHMISSKYFTQYPDYWMPRDYPDYPHHRQVLDYLRQYAEHFGLAEKIQFGTSVQNVTRAPGGNGWLVELSHGECRHYGRLVLANGHHVSPRIPEYPGTFTAEVVHSSEYKTADILAGKRVLVVGGGNSGCDIAVEAAQNADRCWHSTRRGYYYVPKYLFGLPADRAGDWLLKYRAPLWLRRVVTLWLLRMVVGPAARNGLPKPDHRIFETHPIVNTLLPYYVKHGDVVCKPDIRSFDGQHVEFVDGSREEVDLIVFATGYNIDFPWMDKADLNWHNGRPRLFRHFLHPAYDDLFIAGMIQPDSGIFQLVHWQALVMARFSRAVEEKRSVADYLRQLKHDASEDLGGGIHYQHTSRHSIEVEHWSYRRGLMKIARRLERGLARR